MLIRRTLALAVSRISVALLLLAAQASAQTTPHTALINELRKDLQAVVAADDVGSIMAALVVGDSVVWSEGFGWADRKKKTPATAETIYRIGSISKTFTAAVLAQLVDRKVVALDDPVEKYFPEIRGLDKPRPGASPITFRHLASHTAGIIREPNLSGAASGPIADWEAKVLASIPATSFDTVPGARYAYSNIGYGILGLALSRAAKSPFMKLVEDGIFKPLGMTSSTFIIGDQLRPFLSTGYGPGTSEDTPAREHLGRGYKVPNGGIYTTVTDLARFMGALMGAGRPILSDTMRRAMLTKQTPGATPGSYGLGLQLTARPGEPINAGHGGAVAGYTCAMAFDPEAKVGVILLRNYMGQMSLDRAAQQMLRGLVTAQKRG
jgi:CubicO group peptidase (beta-lactamase class C family)